MIVGAQDNETNLRELFTGADFAFVNTNTWIFGIKNETYVGIRTFELAAQCGVKHYIWSSLDNFGHETRYDDSVRAVHYYGKAHVEQWISALPQSPMRWSILTTSPYMEQLFWPQAPIKTADGTYEFRIPLKDGAIPYTALDDNGFYVHWILEHPDESAGLNVKVGIEHVTLPMLAATFTEVTGKPARAVNVTVDQWVAEHGFESSSTSVFGSKKLVENDPSLVPRYDSLCAWWNIYQRSGGNTGLLRRDYAFLDRIHPTRIKSLKQWMQKYNYTGDRKVLFSNTQAAPNS